MQRNGFEITSVLPLSGKNHVWLKSHDHNQLRLTRAIRSLYLLGNEQVAINLSEFLVTAANEDGTVSDKTIQYWRNAWRARTTNEPVQYGEDEGVLL